MRAQLNGKYFEEFNIGDTYVTPSRTVTEADIVHFAGISGDFNQIHTDDEFAKKLPFKGRIAHGLLTLAIG
ncbi:MAG: MaoC/PaaZ C-terminal domain-containing protein, partial [Pseudomonadota bacterium]